MTILPRVTLALLLSSHSLFAAPKVLTVYTERKEALIKPLFDLYQQKTGTSIRFVSDQAPVLLQKISAEGSKSPADILITVDAGSLWNAAQLGVLDKFESPTLKANVPENRRDAEGRWFGITERARTLVYNPDLIKAENLKGFAQLGDAGLQKKLCLRSSKKVYNQSLVAMLMAEKGEVETEKLVKAWVQNLAAPVFQDDTALIEAVAAGQCAVGVVNSYYYGRLQEKKPDIKAKLFWPKLADGGVHINITGAGILKNSAAKKEALAFLEWLTGPEAQEQLAALNHEFPVNKKVKSSAIVQSWGSFEASPTPVSKAGEWQEKAIKLMDRVGYL